jgi:hypothetical protein
MWLVEDHNCLSLQSRIEGKKTSSGLSLLTEAQKVNVESPFVQDLLSNKRKKAKQNHPQLEILAQNP